MREGIFFASLPILTATLWWPEVRMVSGVSQDGQARPGLRKCLMATHFAPSTALNRTPEDSGASGLLKLDAATEAALPEDLKAHLPAARQAAERNVARANERQDGFRRENTALLRSAADPRIQKTSRVMMLRHVAGAWSDSLKPVSACRKGCNHCCHIPVTVSESEARLIAKKTGRKLRQPLTPKSLYGTAESEQPAGYDNPCVFLVEDHCTIYEHRPLVCRTLVNMDDDETLCKLVPGVRVPVPYANATQLQALMAIAAENDIYADLRDWFRP